eukprot:scaffold1288_cov84-Cylindrotheca_fusiformis.AAC.2
MMVTNALLLQNQPLDGGEEDVNALLLLDQLFPPHQDPFEDDIDDGDDVNAPPVLGQPENGNVGAPLDRAVRLRDLEFANGGHQMIEHAVIFHAHRDPLEDDIDDGDDVNALPLLDQLFPPHQDPLEDDIDDGDDVNALLLQNQPLDGGEEDVNALLLLDQLFPPHQDPFEDDIDDGDDVNAPPVLGQPENGNVGAPLDRAVRLRDLEFANGGHQMIEPAVIFHAHRDPLEDDIDDGDDNQPLDGGEEDVNAPLLPGQPEDGDVGAPPDRAVRLHAHQDPLEDDIDDGDDVNAPLLPGQPLDGGEEDVNALLLLGQLFPPHQDPLDRDPLEDDIDRAVRLRDLEFANGGHQMIEPAVHIVSILKIWRLQMEDTRGSIPLSFFIPKIPRMSDLESMIDSLLLRFS